MPIRFRTFFCATLLLGSPMSALSAGPARVVSTSPSPLTTTSELIERLFSPLDAYQLQGKLDSAGLKDPFHIDLAAERFLVRVPEKPDADGRYGLLLFVDSRKQARIDPELYNVLDAHRLVLVSPDNAGDDARALDRRLPLALHAYEYARQAYNLDPERVYVVGDAGGSRIAQRLAFSFPDVFTGALVNAGAVEIGTQEQPAPAPEMLQRLRGHSRIAFATSKHDQPAFSEQQRALKSMGAFCIPVARIFDNGHTIAGHAHLDSRTLSDLLATFEAPPKRDEQAQARCEEAFRGGAVSALASIRQLQTSGRREEALKALVGFDHSYGRLFLEDEVAAAKQLNPGFFGASSTAVPDAPAESR